MRRSRNDVAGPGQWAVGALAACIQLAACSHSDRVPELAAPTARAAQAPERPPAVAARDVGGELVALARRDNRVQEHLRTLTVAIGPRLSASHNLMTAERWARARFEAWGLEAELEPWGSFPVGFDRGPSSGAIIGEARTELEFMTRSWSAGTEGPVRGPALFYPPDLEALAAMRDNLSAAWIVHPDWNRSERPRKRERDQIEEAFAREGIAGNVHGWGSDLLTTSGDSDITWEELPKDVAVYVAQSHFADLERRLREGELTELEFDVANRFFPGPVVLNNVVADLVGEERPDEYVIVCAHLDSWDGAQGAVDNATGVATTLEAARLLAAVDARPKRTIRFILWSGEEQGLFGSRAYVAMHPELHPKISAVLNHDEGTNYLAGLQITPEMGRQMERACAPLFGLDPRYPFELVLRDGLSASASSDHAPFVQAGIPAFFWSQEGRSDYSHMHHTQHDNFDMAIAEYQEHSALVVALAAYGLANLDEPLVRSNMGQIPRRQLGASLSDVTLRSLRSEGVARSAGLQEGDVILEIDGVTIESRGDVARELQRGGALKLLRVRRGEETVDVSLDFSTDPAEVLRAERRASRARLGIQLDL